jgi:hypothetical protein
MIHKRTLNLLESKTGDMKIWKSVLREVKLKILIKNFSECGISDDNDDDRISL